jgi:hypothetical protein
LYIADSTISQAVFETSSEEYSQVDLSLFQTSYGLPQKTPINVGEGPTTACTFDTCLEGNLDLQYIMGLAQQSPTAFWFTNGESSSAAADPFVDFVISVPYNYTTLSISWGGPEVVRLKILIGFIQYLFIFLVIC